MIISQKKKKVWVSVVLASLAFLMLSTAAHAQRAKAPSKRIKIGIIGPMKFIVGEHQWCGATLATDEINTAGGVIVKGERHDIELVKGDTNEILSVSDAVSTMEKVITVDKVNFLIGGFRTEALLAMQEIMATNRIIFIGCAGGTHPNLNERVAANYDKYKYWFRLAALNSMYLVPFHAALVDMIKNAVKKELGVETPRIALFCDKAVWVDPIVEAYLTMFPKMGMEVSGVWRPSPIATDVTADLAGIRAARTHIILAMLTGPAGVVFSRQWGELQIPAATAGSIVESMGKRHWDATGGMCNYEVTAIGYGRVAMTEKTIPFFDEYLRRFGEYPTQSSATYDAVYILKGAIERAGTIESNAVVPELEKTDYRAAYGRVAFNPRGHKWPHDVIWGPEHVTWNGVQWRDGKHVVVWPDGRAVLGDKRWIGIRYKGTVDYQLPPLVVKYWKGEKVK